MKDKTEMNQADVIEKEILTLAARREALATDATTAQGELEQARKSLVAGKADVAQVNGAQLTATTLTEAVRDIDAQLGTLREELAQVQASDAREAKLARLAELAAEGQAAFAEHQAAQAELNNSLLSMAKRAQDTATAVTRKRREFLDLMDTLVPNVGMGVGWYDHDVERGKRRDREAQTLLDELRLRGVSLDVVLSRGTGPTSQIDTDDLARSGVPKNEPFAYGEMFLTILKVARAHEQQNAPPPEPPQSISVAGRPPNPAWSSKAA